MMILRKFHWNLDLKLEVGEMNCEKESAYIIFCSWDDYVRM